MSADNLVGKKIGPYELREHLGSGAMSTVYRAFHVIVRREVVIKIMSSTLDNDPQFKALFEREMTQASALEHAYIAPVYDFGTDDGLTYFARQSLNGGSLADRMFDAEGKPRLPSLGEATHLLVEMANALDYAHKHGSIHGALNPRNILFDEQDKPYLVDFGVARLTRTAPAMTAVGMVIGTPAYMAPEQWRGESLTAATDQYVLAVMLYQMLAGETPFDSPTPYAMMHKHVFEAPPPLHEKRSDLPKTASDVVLKALAKKPDERYPTLTDFAQAFKTAIKGVEGDSTGFFTRPKASVPTHIRHLFLSYSRADAGMMKRLVDDLRTAAFSVWTDENLTPGTPSWKDGIEKAIEDSNAVVVILSPDSKQSEWVKRELDYAMAYNIPIFPVLARGDERSSVPFALISAQRADVRADYAAGLQSLITAIRKQLVTVS